MFSSHYTLVDATAILLLDVCFTGHLTKITPVIYLQITTESKSRKENIIGNKMLPGDLFEFRSLVRMEICGLNSNQ